LVAHLQSDDFFDVESYPEACFAFQKAEVSADPPGCQNLKLHGELTLRGETRPMTIGAAAGFTPEGQAALQATVAFDRTDWGVLYGSGKFFKRLAGHLVNDHVELQLRVVTAKPVRSASGTPP
jgi:polyisoprenoid-binding protein YceI